MNTSFKNVIIFRLVKFNVYVYAVNRPSSYSTEENAALISFLQQSCSEREVIILGDFNLPSLDWASPDDTLRAASASDVRFLDLFDSLGLTQWITEPSFPRSGNILDLILTSDNDRTGEVAVNPPPPGCDHCSIHCSYIFDSDYQSKTPAHSHLMWHWGQYNRITQALCEIDWDVEFRFLSAQDSFALLLSILQPLILQNNPTRKQGQLNSKLPWKRNPPTS